MASKAKLKHASKNNKKPSNSLKEITVSPQQMWFLFFLLIGLTLLAYSSSFSNDFVYDDIAYVTENPLFKLKGSELWKQVWVQNVHGNYHPLTMLTLAIDFSFHHLNPFGFHVTNFILHLLNSLLIGILFFRLSENKNISWLGAILFALHPLHVESVAWITERKDLLYTCFFLGSWILMDKWKSSGNIMLWLGALLLFVASCLSKGMAVVLPLLILLGWWWKGIPFKRNIKENIQNFKLLYLSPFFLVSLVFGITAIKVQQSFGFISVVKYPFFEKLLYLCYGLVFYPIKTILPFNLSALYPYPIGINNLPGWEHYLAFPMLIVFIILIIRLWKNHKIIPFMVLFYLFSISIVLQIIPIGEAIVADRYAYVSTIGFIFGISWFCVKFITIKRNLIYGLCSIVILLFAYLTFQRGKVWKNNETLFRDMSQKFPRDPLGYYNVGNYLEKDKQFQEAIVWYKKALIQMPDYIDPLYSVGSIYGRDLGQTDSGIYYLEQAVKFAPKRTDVLNNLAVFYFNKKDYKQSIEMNKRTLEINPQSYEAWFNLGNAWMNLGNLELAKTAIEQAVKVKPDFALGYHSLGNIAYSQGRFESQISYYKEAARLGNKETMEWLKKNNQTW